MSKKYDRPKSGEWVRPFHRGYKFRCCDCGLVHRMDFRARGGAVEFRVFLDKRATAASRRERRKRDARKGRA
ncbi:MAG: hypothetical protein M3167_06130 [Acidobacteriota bacterium]|nr:hypothetical protein [Acidobacteriota bacterium]MDQ6892242.1 hypothetical protein [Acidobacteriota bacterium]